MSLAPGARLLGLALGLLMAGCAGQATPLPAGLPTELAPPTPPTATDVPAPIRYALTADTAGYVADLPLLQASAQVEFLTAEFNPADLGARYDVVAGYGERDGWARSEVTPHAALIVGAVDPPEIQAIVRQVVQPQAVAASLAINGAQADAVQAAPPETLRAAFANLGIPDGIGLALGSASVPGSEQIAAQFEAVNIDIRLRVFSLDVLLNALETGEIQAALAVWTTPEQRERWAQQFGAENVIDLYTLPISYLAVDDLTIRFTPGGWPLAER